MTDDRREVFFDFSGPYEIHDDAEILARLGLHAADAAAAAAPDRSAEAPAPAPAALPAAAAVACPPLPTVAEEEALPAVAEEGSNVGEEATPRAVAEPEPEGAAPAAGDGAPPS